MENYRILHTTDWHINDPKRIEEQLRSGYYRDYINKLYNEMEQQGKEKIDLLVCSGDFVDKGLTDNFEYVKEVLDYFAMKFSIDSKNIITTIGNHDLKVLSYLHGEKTSFDQFAANYGQDNVIIKEDLFCIKQFDDKVFVLVLDSIFNEDGEINNDNGYLNIIRPSDLKEDTIDKIVTSIEKNILNPELLLIVTHFPMSINNRMEIISEEPGWIEKHFWKSGKDIMQRITDNRPKLNIVCLYGDGHADNFWSSSDKHHFFMTGMFGGNYLERTVVESGKTISIEKTNDAKVIEFIDGHSSPGIFTFSYYPLGSKYSSQTGSWKMEVGKIIIENKTSIKYPKTNEIEKRDSLEKKVELINEYIQDRIIENTKDRDLYFFARTMTSKSESSLGWISISKLFEDRELLNSSIDKVFTWINKISSLQDSDSCVLIGLGFWGGIFASQVNVRRNNLCYLVSSKRIRHNRIHFESIDYISNEISSYNIKEVIILTDVISTGNSIIELKQKLNEKIDTANLMFFAFSILSDKNQQRLQRIEEFHKIGSLCIDLPIPVIENDKLPDEDIFPVEYDLR